jgi:hypothetical protein
MRRALTTSPVTSIACVALALAAALLAQTSRAQDAAATDADDAAATDDGAPNVHTVIDEAPFASARAAGLGGALVTTADDMDAAFKNPAGIGGLGLGKKDNKSWIRKLWFPLVSVEANANSKALYDEAKASGATTDSTIGRASLDAHAGERQFARAGFALGFVLSRTMVLPFNDLQVAAVGNGDDEGTIDVRYRALSGVGAGFSAQDPNGTFSLGYFGYGASRTDVTTTMTFAEVIDADLRTAALKENTNKSTGVGHNVGFVWRLAKAAAPTLGVSVKDAGDTRFKAKTEGEEDVVQKQDLTMGFSLAPTLGKAGTLTVTLEAGRLTDDEISFTKKYRAGVEWTLWGSGSYAALALRGGYNAAGGAGGLLLNLGLVGFEGAMQSVDIGVGNDRVIEQRFTATTFVNVAEF